MDIIRFPVPTMTIEDFAEQESLTMVVRERRVPIGNNMRYYAMFSHCEVMKDGCLVSVNGNGASEESAIRDYASVIALQRVVVDAYTEGRREIDVPRL